MGLLTDLGVMARIVASPVRGKNHADRLDSFYAGQAHAYDDTRRKLLHGREELYRMIQPPEGGVWLDFGGGTGANLEALGEGVSRLRAARIVDLSSALLAVARKRIEARGWRNVSAVNADVTTYTPDEGQADVITFSYSLTMIPDWFAAIERAHELLKPGGRIGVVDFFVARKYPEAGRARHRWFTRTFFPTWFAFDNVNLSRDHLPFLMRRFKVEHCAERRGPLWGMPLLRVPYYQFIGVKA
jgi:S-adenosylmethionine-diacylgycerolhomoserine-N-methlytransferase